MKGEDLRDYKLVAEAFNFLIFVPVMLLKWRYTLISTQGDFSFFFFNTSRGNFICIGRFCSL